MSGAGDVVTPRGRNGASFDAVRACRAYVFSALSDEMRHRHLRPETWIQDERMAVAVAANQWAEAHGQERRITIEDIERIEGNALGHIDYASKLALYVGEFIIDPADWQLR